MLRKRPSLYVVEDEPVLYENLVLQFRLKGFDVKGGGIGADDVYDKMRNDKERVDVILADLDIMCADTVKYSYYIKALQPDVKFVFFTVHEKLEERVRRAVEDLKAVVVKRPFEIEDMIEVVRRVAESSSPVIEDVIKGGDEDGEKGNSV